jgi:hypothetical protein
MNTTFESEYSQRLFEESKLRAFYHNARFHWFQSLCRAGALDTSRLLEIGCFDGRLLRYCDPEPDEYVGLDANWEGGLDKAKAKFSGDDRVRFIATTSPASLNEYPDRHFSTVVAQETLEHIDPAILEDYFHETARVLDGKFIATVPNELGPVFATKYLSKKILYEGSEDYTFAEFVNASIGRMDRVRRDNHKGFDYRQLIKSLSRHFKIVSVEGLPFRLLPPALSLTVAIVAKSKG